MEKSDLSTGVTLCPLSILVLCSLHQGNIVETASSSLFPFISFRSRLNVPLTVDHTKHGADKQLRAKQQRGGGRVSQHAGLQKGRTYYFWSQRVSVCWVDLTSYNVGLLGSRISQYLTGQFVGLPWFWNELDMCMSCTFWFRCQWTNMQMTRMWPQNGFV